MLVANSCNYWHHNQINSVQDTTSKGIVFLIDDAYVEDFYQLKHYRYIQENKIQMTYFICKRPQLPDYKKNIIKVFQNDGHEIAFHGTHHINAIKYLKNHSIEEYINYEILPGLNEMYKDGLDIVDFSYPYGAHTPELDSVLFNRFFYFIKLGSTRFYFYDRFLDKQIIHPFPLDRRYWVRDHLSLNKVLSLIDSADKKNKIIMLYGHAFLIRLTLFITKSGLVILLLFSIMLNPKALNFTLYGIYKNKNRLNLRLSYITGKNMSWT